jgi:hypothetical protein
MHLDLAMLANNADRERTANRVEVQSALSTAANYRL